VLNKQFKKKVAPIFRGTIMENHTIMVVGDIPVPPKQHIFGVDSIMKKKPGKKIMLCSTFTLP
jgi:hypothetical protein